MLKTISAKKASKKINFLPFNRDSTVRDSLVQSMNKYGFIGTVILITTDLIDGVMKDWVVDGQHRLKTAMYLGLDINYYVSPKTFKTKAEIVEFVSTLNSSSRTWNINDYVNAYSFLNYKHYIELQKLTSNSPYTTATVAALLYGVKGRTSGRVNVLIQNGSFEIHNLNHFNDVMTMSKKLSKYHKNINRTTRPSSRMILALSLCMTQKNWNASKFEKAYKKKIKEVIDLRLDDYAQIFKSWL